LSEGSDEGKMLARGKIELHIVSEHNDDIESPESHGARMTYLEELRKAIKATHGLESAHQDTVPVREVFQGKTTWEGDVEVFVVAGHPNTAQCFAWGVRRDDDKEWDVTTILAMPPVVTAKLAVKVTRRGKPSR
jgi:hypothetical protein